MLERTYIEKLSDEQLQKLDTKVSERYKECNQDLWLVRQELRNRIRRNSNSIKVKA